MNYGHLNSVGFFYIFASMKRTIIFLATSVLLLSSASVLYADRPKGANLTVGTYNIRYQNTKDSIAGNGWEERIPWILSLVEFVGPDILGTQEATPSQRTDLIEGLAGYSCIGVGRNDGENGPKSGEHSLVFYRTDRFKLLDHGDFWLSETPDVPSKGWDAALPRICTWGCLRDRVTHKRIWIFNLHNDHRGVQARLESSKLVVKKVKEMTVPKDVVFITGDYNLDQNSEVYNIYAEHFQDSYETALYRYAPNGTFNAWQTAALTESRIDHIFVNFGIEILNYGVLTETYRSPVADEGGLQRSANFPSEIGYRETVARLPSDHFPVFIKVKL